MIAHLAWYLFGGFCGAATILLAVIAGQSDRRPWLGKTRTVNRSGEIGKGWVIAAADKATQTAQQSWKDTSTLVMTKTTPTAG